MMREVVFSAAYAVAIVAATLVHDVAILATMLAAASLLAGRDWVRVASRAFRAILVFNGLVTVSYTALSLVRGDFSLEYLILVNVRVFLMAFLTVLAARRINLLRVFSFSRSASYVITLAVGQIVTFRRMLDDMRKAMASRTAGHVGLRDLYRHAASSASFFFLRTMNDASEITDGMKSRGFFDD